MHPLHEYVEKQLADRVKARHLVVWYDVRPEFAPFIAELRGAPKASGSVSPVSVAGISAQLGEYEGSFFELRALVEPHVSGDSASNVVLYLPGCERDRRSSVLMEIENAGECYEPQLKRLARNVLRQRYTDGVIDEMLAADRVTYEDLARAAADTSSTEPPSILKTIFHDTSGNDALLAAWLASDARDAAIESKEATRELVKLVRSPLGLELPGDAALSKLRAITLRFVLAGEFRSDLRCAPPASVAAVPAPKTKDDEAAVRELARRLRTSFAGPYADMADHVEKELGLRNVTIAADSLGSIDTFRFGERALLSYCGELIAEKKFDEALAVIIERKSSFWLDRDVTRKAQWEACRRMAELGSATVAVRAAMAKMGNGPASWVDAYTSKDGWYRMDQEQRRLEVLVTKLEEEPEERPLGVVRRAYEDACHSMAEGFTRALAKAKWTVPGAPHQTRVYSEVVADRPKPAAYFARFVADGGAHASTRRRLFVDDAAQGVGLLAVAEKKFDVVLMNPPFGAGSTRAKKDFEKAYPKTKSYVYAAFVERSIELLSSRGRVGAITSRTGVFLSSFQKWREEILLKEAPPAVFADLGAGVLDSAMVETAAYCLGARA
jgi:hypothetical protein